MTNNEHKSSEIVSDEVNDMINYRPQWIVRRGNSLFFLIVLSLLSISCFIRYPDMIKCSMQLTALNQPKLLIAKTEGKIQKLLVKNEEQVREGQPVAFLQSTANHSQILSLQAWIARAVFSMKKNSLDYLLTTQLPDFSDLGELQPAYQEFQNTLKETVEILGHGYYLQKRQALQKDLAYLTAMQESTKRQQQLLQQDYELQQNEYEANESLLKDHVIAPLELNQAKRKLIAKRQGIEQANTQMISSRLAELNKGKELLELQKYLNDQKQKFRSALLTLKTRADEWIGQYIIVAPETGKLLFTNFLQENQTVAKGQDLFYLQPNQNIYYGQMKAGQTGLGKIRAGQKVLIQVASYPSDEFGNLAGIIDYISAIPTAKDSFLIKVDLPDGLETSYHRTIFFRNNLSATAEVMTDNRRLIDKFMGQFTTITRR